MAGRIRPRSTVALGRLKPSDCNRDCGLRCAALQSYSPPLSGGHYDGGTVINLYVGNLPFSTTSDDLAALFGKVGAVTSAQVITDRETGRSRGFGFVEMGDDDARKAIDELTGANMGGRSITVNEARPRAPRENRGGPRRDDRRY
jgi:cold-inducible RNA-binding protein